MFVSCIHFVSEWRKRIVNSPIEQRFSMELKIGITMQLNGELKCLFVLSLWLNALGNGKRIDDQSLEMCSVCKIPTPVLGVFQLRKSNCQAALKKIFLYEIKWIHMCAFDLTRLYWASEPPSDSSSVVICDNEKLLQMPAIRLLSSFRLCLTISLFNII